MDYNLKILKFIQHGKSQVIRKKDQANDVRKELNKYYAKTTRNAIKALRGTTNKEEAVVLLPKLTSMLDKLAKKSIIHKKKASNLKSSLVKHVNSL